MNKPKSRCIVLVNEHHQRPEPLLNGLVRRGATPLVVEYPVQVMVQLASELHSVVVIDRPEAVDKVPELLAAVRRYYPRAACWGYQASSRGQPASLVRIDQLRARSNESSVTRDGAARPTTSGLRGEPVSPEADANRLQPIPDTPRVTHHNEAVDPAEKLPEPLITPEELSMLIGSDFGDDECSGQDQATERGTELGLP